MAGSSPLAGEADASTPRVERVGARVLLFDTSDAEPRVLMVLGHDPHAPQRSFWFTPGGGLEDGESSRRAAARELREETGLVLTEDELRGPVWRRTAVFDFASKPYVQHEEFFVADKADADARAAEAAQWTADEHEAIDGVAWMTRSQLMVDGREVFPANLLLPWDALLDWDGHTIDLGIADE